VTVTTRVGLACVTLVLVAAACGSSGPSAGPSLSPSPGSTSSAGPSSAASGTPTSSPSVGPSATPSPSAVPSPSAGPSVAACADLPQAGRLPSDRLTDVQVSAGPDADRLTFVFGSMSVPPSPAAAQGSLEVARPPYSQAGSGAAIDMVGQRVLVIRFTGMSLANDVGQPTYDGPAEIKPDLTALRHAVLFDASEGIIGWYVGYDGSGCVSLVRNGNIVTLVIERG